MKESRSQPSSPFPSTTKRNEPHPFLQEVVDAVVLRKLAGHRPYVVRVNPRLEPIVHGLDVLARGGHKFGIPVVADPECDRFEVVG